MCVTFQDQGYGSERKKEKLSRDLVNNVDWEKDKVSEQPWARCLSKMREHGRGWGYTGGVVACNVGPKARCQRGGAHSWCKVPHVVARQIYVVYPRWGVRELCSVP